MQRFFFIRMLVFELINYLLFCYHAAVWCSSCYASSGNDSAGWQNQTCILVIFIKVFLDLLTSLSGFKSAFRLLGMPAVSMLEGSPLQQMNRFRHNQNFIAILFYHILHTDYL